MHFLDKLNSAIERNHSLLCLGLDPNPEMLPPRYGSGIQALGKWLFEIVEQTSGLVCAYKPTLGFYQGLGSQGLTLLEAVLARIPGHIPVILDAKHSDLNTGTLLAQHFFEDLKVDAVTVNPYPGQDAAAPFLLYPQKAVFVLCHTSNPEAAAIQNYPSKQKPLYVHIAQEAQGWGLIEQLGLEVGTTEPEILARIRGAAPDRLLLLRSIWSGEMEALLKVGLDSSGSKLLIPVPQTLLAEEDLASKLDSLRQDIEKIRTETIAEVSNCTLWQPDVCLIDNEPHHALILQMYDAGCILFGDYVQASGATFPYYIDLRRIISNPQLFHQVLLAYAEILEKLHFDRIAGIPYGSLPTATGLALHLNRPLIFPRKEVKAHGTRRAIEGHFLPGEKIVVVDDILISGKSAVEGAQKLQSAGLKVEDIVVFIEHKSEASVYLQKHGYNSYAVLPFAGIARTLHRAGRIHEEEYLTLLQTPSES
jgi:uridine monophosphate synthetase